MGCGIYHSKNNQHTVYQFIIMQVGDVSIMAAPECNVTLRET